MLEQSQSDIEVDPEVDIDSGEMGEVQRKAKSKSKRKGSPLQKVTLKKQNSLPDISTTVSALKKPMTFSDMMLKTFEDKSFINTFTPLLCEMISPVVQKTVENSIKSVTEKEHGSMVEKMVQSNRELQDLVKKQIESIETQKKIIESQREQLNEHAEDIQHLKSEISSLKSKIGQVQQHSNDVEQYGRRNSVRISNFSGDPDGTEVSNIKLMANFINTKLLQDKDKISTSDIERCHPVGSKKASDKSQFLVKFSNYHTKSIVFNNKSKLKNNKEKIFMTEDLTKANHAIVQLLIQLKKAGKINSFWTKNGNVYAKQKEGGSAVRLHNISDVNNMFGS